MSYVKRAKVEFSLSWRSGLGLHKDTVYHDKVDYWRDIYPGNMLVNLEKMKKNDCYAEAFQPGQIVPAYSEKNLIEIPKKVFSANEDNRQLTLKTGRYYPRSTAWKELRCFPEDTRPFRILDEADSHFVADLNHPLSQYNLVIESRILGFQKVAVQRGGTANDISEIICQNGPGMQLPVFNSRLEMYGKYPFKIAGNVDAAEFYSQPRLVQHVDSTARNQISEIYSRLLKPEMKILDLMSSVESHLPDQFRSAEVIALGMNEEELQANNVVADYVVHDLNENFEIPFSDSSFDTVICTVSFEYLSHPIEIISEIERVLVPDGVVAIIISDRWFPGQEIEFWSDLHPFERQGFVLKILQEHEGLVDFHSESFRGYPRPENDLHYGQSFLADPVFAIWARKIG